MNEVNDVHVLLSTRQSHKTSHLLTIPELGFTLVADQCHPRRQVDLAPPVAAAPTAPSRVRGSLRQPFGTSCSLPARAGAAAPRHCLARPAAVGVPPAAWPPGPAKHGQ